MNIYTLYPQVFLLAGYFSEGAGFVLNPYITGSTSKTYDVNAIFSKRPKSYFSNFKTLRASIRTDPPHSDVFDSVPRVINEAGDHAPVSANPEIDALLATELVQIGTFRERFGAHIPEWLSERLEQGGFSVPTSVQAEAIETVVVQGRDALVQAYTGNF